MVTQGRWSQGGDTRGSRGQALGGGETGQSSPAPGTQVTPVQPPHTPRSRPSCWTGTCPQAQPGRVQGAGSVHHPLLLRSPGGAGSRVIVDKLTLAAGTWGHLLGHHLLDKALREASTWILLRGENHQACPGARAGAGSETGHEALR